MSHHIIIVILLLRLFSVAHAQDKPQTTDAARREKAVELLQSLATQVSNLRSAENRARIGANIADSLWAHDEKRARALFIGIEDDINWGLRVRQIKNPEDDYTSMVFRQLRTDIVTRIAKHDGEPAFDFLRATAPTDEKLPRSIAERERAFELKLATQIVERNPDLALKIGRQSLSRGFSDNLLPLIDAAAKLDDFDTHYLREGEWNMSADGPLGEVLTDLSQNAAYYAWTDFDRAVNLAGQFERAEIRMMAQTKLAQSILAGPPKRFKIPTRPEY